MCGIFGYVDFHGRNMAAESVQKMGDVITHRGPDDSGIFFGQGLAIGNRRLSIIDLEGGHQPFISDDGLIAVVQNGEIFNFVELADELRRSGVELRTRSDTEVLLRLYEREGLAFLPRLNGMFAIAIHDGRRNELHLVRDRVGVKPLYTYEADGRLLFASEIKSLLVAGVPARLDMKALDAFLAFNYVPPPLTVFRDVKHLAPGHVLTVSGGSVQINEWWSLTAVRPVHHVSEQDWIAEFMRTLDDAVRVRMRCDVSFGAFLSGGVDSSTVVGLMQNHATEPVRTYSIGFHEPRYDESAFAAMAAERFQTRHTLERVDADLIELWPMAIRHCDQPHGDISFIPTYQVSALAANEVKVVLTGDGADELFAGYEKYQAFFAVPGNEQLRGADFARQYFGTLCLMADQGRRRLYRPELLPDIDFAAPQAMVAQIVERYPEQDAINLALLIDTHLLLPGNNLVKPDRMGMAVSLEARTPFLDYRMVELAFAMPGELKLKNGETKYLYKKAVAPLIGDELAYRKKQMFTVPVGEWFRDRLYGYCENMLLSDQSRVRGIFRDEVMKDMLVRHRAGESNFTREIRALLAVEIWMREFGVSAPLAVEVV